VPSGVVVSTMILLVLGFLATLAGLAGTVLWFITGDAASGSRLLLALGVGALISAPNLSLGSRPAAMFALLAGAAGVVLAIAQLVGPQQGDIWIGRVVPLFLLAACAWLVIAVVKWRGYFDRPGLAGPYPLGQALVLVAFVVFAVLPR
jgi:hypothetical protein